jgi:effector-binding domain-containing protein
MKKWILAALLLLIIIGFIPITTTTDLKINASFFNVYQQLSSPKNWLRWQPDLKINDPKSNVKIDSTKAGFCITEPSITFNVIKEGFGGFNVTRTNRDNTDISKCFIFQEAKTNKTIAVTTLKTTLGNYVCSIVFHSDQQTLLAGLKNYMEDPALYYGFVIKKELTPEKLLAVRKATILKQDLYRRGNMIQSALNDFAVHNDLKVLDHLQLQYVPQEGDSIQVMLGLPVNKKAAIGENIEYMNMPSGKILVGYFKGEYKDSKKLYTAMRRFMSDNYINPIILPFEKFPNDKLPGNDHDKVDMQVVIPYF